MNTHGISRSDQPKRDIHLMIAVPSTETWEAQFGMAMASMMFHIAQVPLVENIREQKIRTMNYRSSLLCQSRQTILEEAIELGCTHILMLDSDMTFPSDTAHRLFARNRTFVGANYVRKNIPSAPVTAALDGGLTYTDPYDTGLEEVLHIGFGVCLLRLDDEVVQLPKPWFSMEWNEKLGVYSGEDVFFCQRLADAGVPVYVDHDLSHEVTHVGTFNYDHRVVGEIVHEPIDDLEVSNA